MPSSTFLSLLLIPHPCHRSTCVHGCDIIKKGVGPWDPASWAATKDPDDASGSVCLRLSLYGASLGQWEVGEGMSQTDGYFLLIFRYYFEAVSLLDPSGYWVSKPSEWCAGFLSWLWSENFQGNTLPPQSIVFSLSSLPIILHHESPGLALPCKL